MSATWIWIAGAVAYVTVAALTEALLVRWARQEGRPRRASIGFSLSWPVTWPVAIVIAVVRTVKAWR